MDNTRSDHADTTTNLDLPTADEIFGSRPPLPDDSIAMQMAEQECIRLGLDAVMGPPAEPEPTPDTAIEDILSRIVPASQILAAEYPQPKYAVKGIIPEGVTFLAGPPKLGKSILALNVAVAVAEGGKALSSYEVDQGAVLYLALEDGERRIQTRLRAITNGRVSPHLEICTQWPRLNQGGIEAIDRWIDTRQDARLLIVDTLKMLRPLSNGRENVYEADYDVIAPLTRIAAQRVALLIVHHTRKALADDPLATVSGSYGLTGAADGVLVLKRARGKADATLSVIGRDVEEQDIALEFKPDLFLWSALGQAAEVQRSQARQEVIDLLKGGGYYQPKDIAELLDKPPATIRKLLHSMVTAGEISKYDRGYQLPGVTAVTGNGNATGNASEGDKPNASKGIAKNVTALPALPLNNKRRVEV